MRYISLKIQSMKANKVKSLFSLSIIGIFFYFMNPYSDNFQQSAQTKLFSLVCLMVLLNIVIVDYYTTSRKKYKSYLNFYDQNMIEFLFIELILLFISVIIYETVFILLIIYYLFFVSLFSFYVVYSSLKSSDTPEFEYAHYHEPISSRRTSRGSKRINYKIKGVIKGLLAQLLVNEETTVENLVLKTVKEMDLELSSYFIGKISLEMHHEIPEIQKILNEIQEFLEEHPVEYEFIKLKDSIRKLG